MLKPTETGRCDVRISVYYLSIHSSMHPKHNGIYHEPSTILGSTNVAWNVYSGEVETVNYKQVCNTSENDKYNGEKMKITNFYLGKLNGRIYIYISSSG